MTDVPVVQDLGLVVGGAAALLLLARPLRLPPLLTFMVAGILLGPVAGLLAGPGSLELFSELGVALLLFVVGLELSFEKIRAIGGTAVVTGVVQVGSTFALGAGLGHLLGFTGPAALMVGLVAAFSSTVVVVKLLDQGGDLSSLHGRLSVGILLVQDVLVAVAITLLGALAGGGEGSGVWAGLGLALLGMATLVVGGAAAGRWLLPRFMGWMSVTPDGLFIVALAWAFGFILAAEAFHLSIELGAFIAGVVLAQLPFHQELERRTHPLVDLFLAVFFVALGARLDPAAMAAVWQPALAVAVFVLVGKPLILALLLGLQGRSRRTSALAALTLGQSSEFSFILAGLAATAGIVGEEFFGFVGLVGFLTIGASAVLVPRGTALVGSLERRGLLSFVPERAAPEPPVDPPLEGHVVVVGMNTLGRQVVRRMVERGERVLAVDTDPRKLVGLPGRHLAGDPTQLPVLHQAGVPRAKLVVSAVQIEDVNSLLTFRCRSLGVPVSIHAFDPSLADELLEMGADHLMVSKHDGIAQMEAALRGGGEG